MSHQPVAGLPEAWKRIGAPCMNKEEVLFQPWVVWYCHYRLDKDFTGLIVEIRYLSI